MRLSPEEQNDLLASKEASRIKASGGEFRLLMGGIETSVIRGKAIKGQQQALDMLNRALGDWSGNVNVTSAYRDRAQQRHAATHGEYGQGNTELSMHMSGQAFDLGVSRQDQERFEQHMQRYGFYNTVGAKDRVHFVYDGRGEGFDRATSGFAFSSTVNSLVKDATEKFSGKYKVEEQDIKALIYIESGGDVNAKNKMGATGILQITGAKWRDHYGNTPVSFDPVKQIEAATKDFARSLERYNGDSTLAAIAWNLGDSATNQVFALTESKQNRKTMRNAIEEVVGQRIKGIYNQKTVDKFFGGSWEKAKQAKINEAYQYGLKFQSAKLGKDLQFDQQVRYQETVQLAQSGKSSSAPKGGDEKEDNSKSSIDSFFNQIGECEANLNTLASNPDVGNKAVAWMQSVNLMPAPVQPGFFSRLFG